MDSPRHERQPMAMMLRPVASAAGAADFSTFASTNQGGQQTNNFTRQQSIYNLLNASPPPDSSSLLGQWVELTRSSSNSHAASAAHASLQRGGNDGGVDDGADSAAADDSTAQSGPATRLRKRRHDEVDNKDSGSARLATSVAELGRQRRSRTQMATRGASPSSTASGRRGRGGGRHTARKPVAQLKKPPPSSYKANLKKPPLVAFAAAMGPKDELDDTKPSASEPANCCICMCDVEPQDLSTINGCDHRFCFGCIEKWSERENTCPLCKNRFTKIDRVHKTKGGAKIKGGSKNTKCVKPRDQRSDLVPSAALEGLLGECWNCLLQTPSVCFILFDLVFLTCYNMYSSQSDFTASISSRGGLANLMFSRMGAFSHLSAASAAASGTTRAAASGPRGSTRSAAAGRSDTDIFLDDSDDELSDSDDDDNPFANFLRTLSASGGGAAAGATASMNIRMSVGGVALSSSFAASSTAHPPGFATHTPSRQYATNASDATAGRGAENPLKIDDDDDDDDSDIEIVGVTPGPNTTRRRG